MKKRDLGLIISKKLNFKNKDAGYIVDRIFEGIKEILKEKGRIEIRGFGSFVVILRKAKKGRIINTGEIVNIPPYKTIVFIPGKIIKEINQE